MMRNLFYIFLLSFALSFSGVTAQDSPLLFTRTAPFSPRPDFEQIETIFLHAAENGATHLLIVEDTLKCDDPCQFVVISYPAQDVEELIYTFTAPGYYRVVAVYATHLDFETQYYEDEGCTWHPEPAENLEADLTSILHLLPGSNERKAQ